MPSQEIQKMLHTIERECEFCSPQTGRRIIREAVLQAMAEVPREEFVPHEQRSYAYADQALPIGEGQTISQPFIVALMTDLLEPQKGDVMLEIGTGSGYQAAVLSRLVKKVYSVEVVPRLAREAAERLGRLGYDNIEIQTGDGYRGWSQLAPFDGIIVTAAAGHVPAPLVDQLNPGACLVIPVGLPYMPQDLVVIEKAEEGRTRTRKVLGVAFVPLTGDHGAERKHP